MRSFLSITLIAFGMFLASPTNAEPKNQQRAATTEKAAISDAVIKMRDDDEGVVVLFGKTPGSYYLKSSSANFDVIRKKLEDSFKNKKTVTVIADPSLYIIDVK